jgi:putative PEP-CTERM system histidine kinase
VLRNVGESGDLVARAIAGLGELVESPGGAIWLRDGNDYRYAGGRNHHGSQATLALGDPLVAFLQRTGWVIDLREFASDPGGYEGLQLPAQFAADQQAWLIVPLALEDELLGFVLLQRSLAPVLIDWEVRDVLKAAAAQICSYLGLRRAIEQLVEARQFETFNRMSAFVVHDLKNLVTQLGLIARNAERHKDNPEFQADMLATVENVRERMQALLLQLRDGTKPFEKPVPIKLLPLLEQVMASKHGMQPVPELELAGDLTEVAVPGHQQRLVRALGHLLQNALEATPGEGRVVLRAALENGTVVIEVRDNGCGMSEDFIRNQLFRAFESTKEQGMGIGTFESREYIRELGGALEVSSQEGIGTTFVVRLPQAGGGESGEQGHAQ